MFQNYLGILYLNIFLDILNLNIFHLNILNLNIFYLTSLFPIGTYETMATSRVETNRHL